MPRSPRVIVPGEIYHVTSRGNRKQPIFLEQRDFALFRRLLGSVMRDRAWTSLSYCLMPNHYHLVVETAAGDLSAGMQRLNGTWGRWFNDAYDLSGHVFQGRFHCVHVDTSGYLLEVVRYVSLNPVRAGLCSSPDGWSWSSYRAAVGLEGAPPFLALDRVLSEFSSDPSRSRARLRAFVEDVSRLPN